MRPRVMVASANSTSTSAAPARCTQQQWFRSALALVVILGLATLAPSAHAQTFTVLHSFTGGADGSQPVFNGLIQSGSGTLFGSTGVGGNLTCNNGAGCGVVFKMDPVTGKETVLHSFTNGADGAFPGNTLLLVGTALYGIGGGGAFVLSWE